MSRSFTGTVLPRALAADTAMPVQFVAFAFGGGTVRITTAPFDIDWDGFTWSGVGGNIKLGTVTESPDDRSGQQTITLSGVDQAILGTILAESYIGRTADVWLGWIAQGSNLVANSGAETNTNGATALASSISRNATGPIEGSFVFRILTTNTAGTGITFGDANTGSGRYPVVAGETYLGGATVRLDASASASVTFRLHHQFFDGGGSPVGTLLGQVSVTLAPGESAELVSTPALAPAGAVDGRVRLDIPTAPGVITFDADRVWAHLGSVQQPYQPTDGAAIAGGSVIDRPYQSFSGFMNGGFEVEESTGRTGSTVTISGRLISRVAALSMPRGIRTNLESHRAVYRLDQFFEFVPGLANALIQWGSFGSAFYAGRRVLGNFPSGPGGVAFGGRG